MTAIRSSARHDLRATSAGRGTRRASRGFVSIEVAILTPLILFTLLGFTELYLYMRAVSLVEHTAFVLAGSLGQRSQVYYSQSTSDPDNLGSIWNAASLLASPLNFGTTPTSRGGPGGVIVSVICDKSVNCAAPGTTASMAAGTPMLTATNVPTKTNTSVVTWQQSAGYNDGTMQTHLNPASPGTLLPNGWPYRAGDSAIVVEVFYKYTPFLMTASFWQSAPGLITIYKSVTVYPRTGKPLPLKYSSS
ncbi:hypothetical protein [Burkholderia sp. Ac-20379]|uniref:hypothetical protein n=1 Tax=Burkholderia sp. Ac-20379 TaxID=2703900 RepID=UPI00197CD194|nr:hypothetical protein [Burkholderia sp. Ac-20379]MBN3726368.1 hypothetical protein [Burkholderia sp. Ac-20379]